LKKNTATNNLLKLYLSVTQCETPKKKHIPKNEHKGCDWIDEVYL